jgi:hypothetical protein
LNSTTKKPRANGSPVRRRWLAAFVFESQDTDYGFSVAPLAGVVVVVPSVVVVSGVVVLVPVPVPVVVVALSSPQPATTNAAIMIIIANRLLIARSPEWNETQNRRTRFVGVTH